MSGYSSSAKTPAGDGGGSKDPVLRGEKFTRRVLDGLHAFVGVLDLKGVLIEVNARPLEAADLAADDVLGKKFWDCYWWDYSEEIRSALQAAFVRARLGEIVRYDVPVRLGEERFIWIDFQLAPLHGDDGDVTQVIASGIDLSERLKAENALRQSERRFRTIFENAAIGIAHVSSDGDWLRVNERLCEIVGYSAGELADMTFQDITHPDDLGNDLAQLRRLIAGEIDTYKMEKRYVRKDGSNVWVSLTVGCDRDPASGTPFIIAAIEDISERKRHEEHVNLLMMEVNHRAKNLLAVVQAIARQTAQRADPQTFADELSERLQGLSASQDLIIASGWTSVPMFEHVMRQLEHLGDALMQRVHIEGNDTHILPAPAQAIGLALHELATNAVKHGSLSNEEGSVEIRWHLEGTRPDGAFVLSWSETNGPPIDRPVKRGFGRTVIEQMVAQSVSGTVTVDYAQAGFTWELRAPVSGLCA